MYGSFATISVNLRNWLFLYPLLRKVYLNIQNVDFLVKVYVFYAVWHGLWLKRIIAAVTGTCIFGDAATFIEDCRVLFGDIFIVPFLGSALGLTAMCSLGWGNLVAFDWNDLPVGREFDWKFLKKVKSPPYALPPPRRHYIDRCIRFARKQRSFRKLTYNLPGYIKLHSQGSDRWKIMTDILSAT